MHPFKHMNGYFGIKKMKLKNKNIILLIIGILFLIGIVSLIATQESGGGSKSTAYSAGALTAPERIFDFSTISMKNGTVSHRFEVQNDGEEPVVIEKVYTSCMCTVASVIDSDGKTYGEFGMPGHSGPSRTRIEVAPGKKAIVEAVFDPAAHGPSGVGLAQRPIYLETNSAASPKLELAFQAMVTR